MTDKENKAVALAVEYGYSEAQAHEMVSAFVAEGGLACYRRWPDDFSMFGADRNMADVLLDSGMMLDNGRAAS